MKPHCSVSSLPAHPALGIHLAYTMQYSLASFTKEGFATVWHTCVTVHGLAVSGSNRRMGQLLGT